VEQTPHGETTVRAQTTRTSPQAVRLGDIPVVLDVVDAWADAAIRGQLAPSVSRVEAAAARLRLGGSAPRAPDRPPDRATPDVVAWYDAETLVLRHHAGVGAIVHGTTGQIGGGDGDGAGPHAVRRLLAPVAAAMLLPFERFLLHGAALVRDQRAFLALGDTGTGKSTLALAALTAGWDVVTDDLLVVRRGMSGLEATGIPRRIAVPDDVADAPDARRWTAAARPIRADARRRSELPVDVLRSGWYPVAGTFLIGHGDAPTGTLRPIAAHDAFSRVVAAFVWSGDLPALHRILPYAAELTRGRVWELRHGAQARSRLGAARRLLAAAVEDA
jgi:hypothetical protein